MLREIVFDTETTGTDAGAGDRVIEIGCIELLNHIPTGRTFHRYLNPQRPNSPGAVAVHGLTDEFLRDKPLFSTIVDEFLDFIGDGRLVAHNAAFDITFLNAEFGRTGHRSLGMDRVIDTLSMARRKHPGAPNNLDALCARYGIDNSRRTKHGALLDAELLAEIYIELIGGKQADLDLILLRPSADAILAKETAAQEARPRAMVSRLSDDERDAHLAFVAKLGPSALWRTYLGERS